MKNFELFIIGILFFLFTALLTPKFMVAIDGMNATLKATSAGQAISVLPIILLFISALIPIGVWIGGREE